MTDYLDPHTASVTRPDTGDPPWPGPLGNPYLTGTQRQRLAEDLVLLSEAQLRPDDHSLDASQLRETATDIRDHRETAERVTVRAVRDRSAGRDAGLPGEQRAHPSVPLVVVAMARREWQRLNGTAAADRVTLVVDRVWQSGYPPSYGSAYTTAASRVVAAVTDAAAANPQAQATLHHLAAAAVTAISRLAAEQPLAPPADHRTVAAAQAAATAGGRAPWRPVADAAWAGARSAGMLAGTLTAATDVLIGWRVRGGEVSAEGVSISGRPAQAWVADLLAAVNRDTAVPIVAAGGTSRTAAQLARQDQAPGVSAPTVGAGDVRARPAASSAPAATPARRAR